MGNGFGLVTPKPPCVGHPTAQARSVKLLEDSSAIGRPSGLAERCMLPSVSNDLAVQLLMKALESTVDEAGSQFAGWSFGRVLPAVLAEPASAVVGTVASELVAALLRETSSLERKVDELLETPLKAASISFREVAAVVSRVRNCRELTQCDHRLQNA